VGRKQPQQRLVVISESSVIDHICHPRERRVLLDQALDSPPGPIRCEDTMIVPLRAACRHASESMIQTLRSLTEEDRRQCLVGETARAGER
jgi:hypothetical protein